MKFGGTSLAEAERIRAAAEIVRARRDRRPVVVVSALAGVTDLLDRAVELAGAGDRDGLDPVVADLERRHRWALGGAVEDASRRHHLGLEIDAILEDLRNRLRSIRILGEATARNRDAVLATGERLATRIVATAFADAGVPAVSVDATRVMGTDRSFGAARPEMERVKEAAKRELLARVEAGEVPVVGGFVGATPEGDPTTLGRGGSDTTAAVLGLALAVEEIQIWTDVDGLMTADPRLVPSARTLPRLSFAEASEMAQFGARVLHPASISPALEREIPVRVLNSHDPEGEGTRIVDEPSLPTVAGALAVTSRTGLRLVRVSDPRMRVDRAFAGAVLARAHTCAPEPELLVVAGSTVTMVFDDTAYRDRFEGIEAVVEDLRERAVVGLVGHGLAIDPDLRDRAITGLNHWEPDLLIEGGARASLLGVVPTVRLGKIVGDLHHRFVEKTR